MKLTKQLYIYYGLLFAINLLAGLRYHGEAPTMMRLAFLMLVIVPAFLNRRILPAIITLFLVSSTAGYVEGIMPSQLYWYAGILCASVLVAQSKNERTGKVPPSLIILFFWVSSVNMVHGGSIENISYSLLIIIVFCTLLRDRDEKTISIFSLVFALISFSLSIMFIMSDPSASISYGYSGMDRVMAFADPNYFACNLGMGALICVIELFRNPKLKFGLKFFYIFVAVISFVVLVLNASRGGILSFSLAVALIVLFSRTRKVGKVFTIVALALLIIFMYENDYFALLEYRMMNDSGGGSQRTVIWEYKLQHFFSGSSPLQMLLGYGHSGGLAIGGSAFGYGSSKVLGFHNDFIAFLVDYGIVGFLLFFSFLYKIFKEAQRNKTFKLFCFAVLLYMIVQIMTLESFTAGGLSVWAFSLYALILAQTKPQTYTI